MFQHHVILAVHEPLLSLETRSMQSQLFSWQLYFTELL